MAKRHYSDSSLISPSSKKAKYECSFQLSWTTEKAFEGLIKPSPEGKGWAFCEACEKSVRISAGGRNDLKIHFERKTHLDAVAKRKQHRPIHNHFVRIGPQPIQKEETTDAEIRMCLLIAKHNMALLAANHLTDLHNVNSPHKKIQCKRTKATQIIKRCLSPQLTDPF